MKLKFYDVAIDDFREPTQADIGKMMSACRAYGRIRHAYKIDKLRGADLHRIIEEAQAELMVSIGQPSPGDGPLPYDSPDLIGFGT